MLMAANYDYDKEDMKNASSSGARLSVLNRLRHLFPDSDQNVLEIPDLFEMSCDLKLKSKRIQVARHVDETR